MSLKANDNNLKHSKAIPNTSDFRLLWPSLMISVIKSLLIIHLTCLPFLIAAVEITSLVPFKSSLDSIDPIVISKNDIPSKMKSNGAFTIAFEFTFVFYTTIVEDITDSIASIGESSQTLKASYQEKTSTYLFNLSTVSNEFDLIEPHKFYDSDTVTQLNTLMFLLKWNLAFL